MSQPPLLTNHLPSLKHVLIRAVPKRSSLVSRFSWPSKCWGIGRLEGVPVAAVTVVRIAKRVHSRPRVDLHLLFPHFFELLLNGMPLRELLTTF